MKRDPVRLSTEGSSPELRALLRAARADVLEPDSVERVRSGLNRAGALIGMTSSMVASGAAPNALGKVLGSLSLKVIGGLAIGSAISAGVWFGLVNRHSLRLKPSPTLPAAQSSSSAPALSEQPARVLPLSFDAKGRVEVDAAANGKPASKAPAPATSKLKLGGTLGAQPPPSPREGVLLLEARKALEADPARALRLVQQHQAEFPTSQLEPERRQIAAQAERRLK